MSEVASFLGCTLIHNPGRKDHWLTSFFAWIFQSQNALDFPFPLDTISQKAGKWALREGVEKPEFWADYCSYDWVAFCQLFGTMMDLPKGLPMYCNDLRQLAADRQIDIDYDYPCLGNHNALVDARWVKKAYDYIIKSSGGEKVAIADPGVYPDPKYTDPCSIVVTLDEEND